MELRNVFVVGPDGTGKTEVSTLLAKELGIPRFKCPTEKDMFVEGSFKEHLAFDMMLPHLVSQTGLRFVSDRGYPCEYAYSLALGRETNVAMLRRTDDLWAQMTDPPLHVLLTMDDYSNAREDDLVENSMLRVIAMQYDAFYKHFSKCPYLEIKVDRYGTSLWAECVVDDILAFCGPSKAVSAFRKIR